jgi:rsbT co-antagonist protein RsbR
MPQTGSSRLSDLLRARESDILSEWLARQTHSLANRPDLISESELRLESREFLAAFARAIDSGDPDVRHGAWTPIREFLARISRSRAQQGFTPSETATFVFSLKQPLFDHLQATIPDRDTLAAELWQLTQTIDSLGLFTTEVFLKNREEVIVRQQQEMMELSTPVVTLWKGVLALPLIGTLDSARTQVVMENLLQRIVDTGSTIAILDITGVPTVDTLVAQHLLKTVAAARLMGADCIISGIRPQIAQTIVHLGVDLNSVTTKATLADAFAVALKRTGLSVTRAGGTGANAASPAPAASTTPAGV